ncbi:hypothetical protein AX15_000644 [Amanita polypyramis BW_CC]|nr:hypothetical protein AX15_000644 [Amanita polypyramis BW_CC]
MAASKSRHSHENPLPPSPEARVKSQTKKGKQKGKEKENVQCTNSRKWQTPPSSGCRKSGIVWDWTTLTDPSASRTPPIYTKDGSYFFSLVGTSVRIYSVATGQVVSTLSAPRSTSSARGSGLLTSAVLNPWNAFQLITGSLDGRLMVWDFLDATLLQTIDIAQPIHHICAHEKFKNSIFVAASRLNNNKKKTDDDAVVLQVSLNPDTIKDSGSRKSPVIAAVGKTRFPTGLAFSPTGTWLVATAGHKVYVATSSSLKSGFVKYVAPERLTCLAFHPFEDYFATGDSKGVIRLWYCLNDGLAIGVKGVEKRTQTTSFHWHAHAVSSITFTPNGAYLLSGGEEAVLVIWQLHSGKREFVPRLGAPISTVSVWKGSGEESYLVGLADTTYAFVSPGSLRVSRSYSGIKLDPTPSRGSAASNITSPMAVHTTSLTLILPSSHPSSLQIYSPSSSKLLYELEVTPSNRVSRRDEKSIEPSRVEKIATSLSGEWMATVDVREEDGTFHAEIYLKIWWWDRKSGYWILNTRIDRPHGLKRMTDLSFSPSSPSYLVTTGEDGNVKIWGTHTAKQRSGEVEDYWVTRSVFGFRSEVPKSASWSSDASLLAISLGPHVAVYDPEFNVIRDTISLPECQAMTTVHFIGKGGRYLAIVGKEEFVLWDLTLQSARWLYRSSKPIQQVIPHDREDTFVVFHGYMTSDGNHTTALTFNAKSPSPMSEQIVPYAFRSIVLYAPSRAAFSFAGITTNWAVVSFGEQVLRQQIEGHGGVKIPGDVDHHKRTLFQDIFGLSAFDHTTPEQPSWPRISSAILPRSKASVAAFDSPSHLLPPISSIFDGIMEDFVRIQAPIVVPTIEVADANDDSDMEIDTPEVVGSQKQKMRQVTQEEMGALVNLFKSHTIGYKYSTPTTNTNGKVNIRPKAMINGNAYHSPSASPSPTRKANGSLTPKPASGKVLPPATIFASLPSRTPPEAASHQSKKRKKSLG